MIFCPSRLNLCITCVVACFCLSFPLSRNLAAYLSSYLSCSLPACLSLCLSVPRSAFSACLSISVWILCVGGSLVKLPAAHSGVENICWSHHDTSQHHGKYSCSITLSPTSSNPQRQMFLLPCCGPMICCVVRWQLNKVPFGH